MSIFWGEKIVKLGLFSLKTLHGIYHNHNYYKNSPPPSDYLGIVATHSCMDKIFSQ